YAPGEAELTATAQEVVVTPAGDGAGAFVGVVADPESHVARRCLLDPYVDIDPWLGGVVLVDADGAEEVQRGDVLPGPFDRLRRERVAGDDGDLALYDLLADGDGPADPDLPEDARRPARHPVGDPRAVVGQVDDHGLLDLDAGIAPLPVGGQEVETGTLVGGLGEHLPGG